MGRSKKFLRERGQKAGKFWRSVLYQYCENTSLHGFRYIVSRDSSLIEKSVWMLVCTLGMVFSIMLMLLIWQRFSKTPTVTTIDTTTHPIFNLNFPAVSICNYNKVYKPKADKLSMTLMENGLHETEISNFFSALPKLIRPDDISSDHSRALEIMASLDFTIEDIMYDVMQPCENLLLRCAWEGKLYDCHKIFKPIKTIEGFCCAFNYHVDTSENSFYGVKPKKKKNKDSEAKRNLTETAPGFFEVLTVPGAGRDVGLSVVLDLEKDSYYGSIRPSVGGTIMIHDPFNYPEVEVITSFVQPNQEIAVILSGSIMESSADVKWLDLSQRNCWFNDEMKLNISSVYSYQSCVTECRIRYIRRYCKCVPFYYPNYFRERVCSLTDVNCLTKYRGSLSNLRTIIDLVVENVTQDNSKCDCLPSCNDNWYLSNSENVFMENVPYISPILKGFDLKKVALASIYFRAITCLKYRKESWMSWDDVLASFGGIFGLCVGGSFVSIVEFLYYFGNKMFRNDKLQQQQQQRFRNTPPARDKFRVVSIDKPHEWMKKRSSDDNIQQQQQSSLFKHHNFAYLHEMQGTAAGSKPQEDLIRNLMRTYK